MLHNIQLTVYHFNVDFFDLYGQVSGDVLGYGHKHIVRMVTRR